MRTRATTGSAILNIAHQPATTAEVRPARPLPARSAHELVLIEDAPRAWTFAKIAALLTVTVLGVAVVTAIVAGTALFALLNLA